MLSQHINSTDSLKLHVNLDNSQNFKILTKGIQTL